MIVSDPLYVLCVRACVCMCMCVHVFVFVCGAIIILPEALITHILLQGPCDHFHWHC